MRCSRSCGCLAANSARWVPRAFGFSAVRETLEKKKRCGSARIRTTEPPTFDPKTSRPCTREPRTREPRAVSVRSCQQC